jgi:lipopolysaccharide biosynthesis glycosyltransferase
MTEFVMNIMTSCDERIADYIYPQLASVAEDNSRYILHFYLFHTDIPNEKVASLARYAESLGITFHNIVITETAPYELFVKYGGNYPKEAYYTIGLERYLPADMKRIMYIDAGDIIINGDIGRFYFADFEDKAILASLARCKISMIDNRVYFEAFDSGDFDNPDYAKDIKTGTINSGAVVYNLDHIRACGYSAENFVQLAKSLETEKTGDEPAYFADQGLLSVGYLDDYKLFGFPQCIFVETDKNKSDIQLMQVIMPFNFTYGCMSFDTKYINYEPSILHYDNPEWKPWKPNITKDDLYIISSPEYMNSVTFLETMYDYQAKFWAYACKTPVYNKIRLTALENCKN